MRADPEQMRYIPTCDETHLRAEPGKMTWPNSNVFKCLRQCGAVGRRRKSPKQRAQKRYSLRSEGRVKSLWPHAASRAYAVRATAAAKGVNFSLRRAAGRRVETPSASRYSTAFPCLPQVSAAPIFRRQ